MQKNYQLDFSQVYMSQYIHLLANNDTKTLNKCIKKFFLKMKHMQVLYYSFDYLTH